MCVSLLQAFLVNKVGNVWMYTLYIYKLINRKMCVSQIYVLISISIYIYYLSIIYLSILWVNTQLSIPIQYCHCVYPSLCAPLSVFLIVRTWLPLPSMYLLIYPIFLLVPPWPCAFGCLLRLWPCCCLLGWLLSWPQLHHHLLSPTALSIFTSINLCLFFEPPKCHHFVDSPTFCLALVIFHMKQRNRREEEDRLSNLKFKFIKYLNSPRLTQVSLHCFYLELPLII